MRNISFSRSLAVSTVFGVNWASEAMNDTRAGITYCGAASSTSRTSDPERDPPRRCSRQEEGHVHVAEIEQVQHPTARGNHFAVPRDDVLDTTIARRLQRRIVDVGLDPLDVCLRGNRSTTARRPPANGRWRWLPPQLRPAHARHVGPPARCPLSPSTSSTACADTKPFGQRHRTRQLSPGGTELDLALRHCGLRCRLLALALRELAARSRHRRLSLLQLRLGLPLLGLEHVGVHHRHDLPGLDGIHPRGPGSPSGDPRSWRQRRSPRPRCVRCR